MSATRVAGASASLMPDASKACRSNSRFGREGASADVVESSKRTAVVEGDEVPAEVI